MLKLLLTILLGIPVSGMVTNSSTGKGIEGVVVSDGYHCTVTDASGRYSLEADSLARTVSITVPAAYEIPLGSDGTPAFFKYIDSGRRDFVLTPRRKVADRFTLVAVTDTHIKFDWNADRFHSECLPDLQRTFERHAKEGDVLGIALGDQISDTPETAGIVKEGYSGFKLRRKTVPFFYCIGNHDHLSRDGEGQYAVTEHFVRNFSPVDYSFDIGQVHFVVMDDIQYKGVQRDGVKVAYYTGITEAQLQWLREDLALVRNKEHKAIVLCIHAPLSGRFSHKDEVKSLLGQFADAHVLSGHEHNINNMWPSPKIWEHNIQALCGAWWHSNLSPSGCPLGYAVLTFDGPALAEEYNKATTESADFQMRVYSGNDSYNGWTAYALGAPKRFNTYGWPEKLRGHFVVRVWDGTKDWEVKFVQNGVERPMKQTEVKFFDAASAGYMVDMCGAPYGGSRVYKPMLDSFWTIEAPSGDPALEKDWEIVAIHRMPSGKEVTYRSKVLMQDYLGFATGTHYLR